METKEELISNIKEWIKIDNEVIKLRSEMKDRNNKKKEISECLVNVMKKNSIDCFDVTGGQIMYKKSTVKKPISSKTLLSTLQTYFENSSDIPVDELTKFIMDNREETVKETIKRKIDK